MLVHIFFKKTSQIKGQKNYEFSRNALESFFLGKLPLCVSVSSCFKWVVDRTLVFRWIWRTKMEASWPRVFCTKAKTQDATILSAEQHIPSLSHVVSDPTRHLLGERTAPTSFLPYPVSCLLSFFLSDFYLLSSV